MKPICEINSFGSKCWYLNDRLHREDGPAYETVYGYKTWYLYGERHREDGPAVEWSDEYKEWWYHGKYINCKDNKEFLRMIKLMVFL